MPIGYNDIEVTVHLDRLVENYTRLQAIAGNCMPVVKSDAYGHGLVQVAAALAAAGATSLAVGTVAEAVQLRQSGFRGRIVALLGPQSADDDAALLVFDILPFIARFDQIERLGKLAARSARAIDLALKFDTGMARLGFAAKEALRVAEALAQWPALRVVLVASHLATSDDPDDKAFVCTQADCFVRILDCLTRELGTRPPASLANSAALLAYPELHFDVTRPGIALYGANPFALTALESLGAGLTPAMDVSAPVLQVHALPKGASISYGRTFTAARDMRVAIIGAGYADAYSRGLSSPAGQGPCVLLGGARRPILGRVCMQMTAVDLSDRSDRSDRPPLAPGDRAFLLGGDGAQAITPEELAGWWGTITYEVFCLLGLNKRRGIGG